MKWWLSPQQRVGKVQEITDGLRALKMDVLAGRSKALLEKGFDQLMDVGHQLETDLQKDRKQEGSPSAN